MTSTRSASEVSARITCSMHTTASPRSRTRLISPIVSSISFGGLTPAEIDDTIGLIRRMRDRGLAVACIEHVMRALTSLADRVLVMHHGATFFEGSPQEMLADERVIEVYLGSRHRKGGAS